MSTFSLSVAFACGSGRIVSPHAGMAASRPNHVTQLPLSPIKAIFISHDSHYLYLGPMNWC